MTDIDSKHIHYDDDGKEYIDDVGGMGYGWTTPCAECIFAKYDGKTQTGCGFGRLDKFKERNVEIIPAFDLEGREFFVVKSFCNALRGKAWGEQYKKEEHVDQVKKEYELRLHYIIIVGGDRGEGFVVDDEYIDNQMNELDKTAWSVFNQSTPAATAIIVNNSRVPQFDIYHKAHEVFDKTHVKFYILDMGGKSDDYDCIDAAFPNVGNGYYVVFKAGHEADLSFGDKFNRLINEELYHAPYMLGYDGINGTVVQASMHRYLRGNLEVPLEQKIREMSKEDGSLNLIRSWEEFDDLS